MVLIGISMKTNNVEHLFVCLLAIHLAALEKCLFRITDSLRSHSNVLKGPSPKARQVVSMQGALLLWPHQQAATFLESPEWKGIKNQDSQSPQSTLKSLQLS